MDSLALKSSILRERLKIISVFDSVSVDARPKGIFRQKRISVDVNSNTKSIPIYSSLTVSR